MSELNKEGPKGASEAHEPKTVTLPDRGEMQRRLISVDNNNSHAVERLHPLILTSAGRSLYGEGVANIIAMALHDYCKDLPPIMARILISKKGIAKYINVLIDDEEAKEEAIQHVSNALGKMNEK